MSFKPTIDPDNQISLFSATNLLTDELIEELDNSWAGYFRNIIYPLIDEKPFSVLYSDNIKTRPAISVKLKVGALILKEILGLSDEELVRSLTFDLRFKYALHITNVLDQPLSLRTLTRFRTQIYNYSLKTGIDLVHETMKAITQSLNELMQIDTSLVRMDSMMVESNIKNLSRYEIIYRCNKAAVRLLKKMDFPVGKKLRHYLNDYDENYQTYHKKSPNQNKLNALINESKRIADNYPKELRDSREYQNLIRVIDEQTCFVQGNLKPREKGDKRLNSRTLQSPVDPEATYRKKAGKDHTGYSANFIQATDRKEDGHNLIQDYQVEENVHSDEEFFKDSLEQLSFLNQGDMSVVADGAYGTTENLELAEEMGINLIPTNLPGKPTDEFYKDFIIDQKENIILCPYNKEPDKTSYDERTDRYYISYKKQTCQGCPYSGQCPLTKGKRTKRGYVSLAQIRRAETQACLKDKEIKFFSYFRNGVEALCSQMRNTFKVDKIPHYGKVRVRQAVGFKAIAYNVKSFFRFMKKQPEPLQA